MKVWMWQRLWKEIGKESVCPEYQTVEDADWLHINDRVLQEFGHIWLCPKPNLVLVDRKHLQ